MTDIIKQSAQILNPAEYEKLREHLNPKNQLILDGTLFTGMRIEEFWRFCDHPDWFHPERQYIDLPPGSILKVKAKMKERQVLLSNIGTRAVRDLVAGIKRGEIEKMTRIGWRANLKLAAEKAGLKPKGIMPKMTRKTWVSWLLAVYPSDGLRISASMGHDTETLKNHYLSIPFSVSERESILMYVMGWGGNSKPTKRDYD